MPQRGRLSRTYFFSTTFSFAIIICLLAFLLIQHNFLHSLGSPLQMQRFFRRTTPYNPFTHPGSSRSVIPSGQASHLAMSFTIHSSAQQGVAAQPSVLQSDQIGTKSNQHLALPEVPANEGLQQLDLSGSGGTVRLDHLGPMVVNQDGSLSRIANWDKMSDGEQKNTLRIIGKRNKQRLNALKQQDSQTRQEEQEE